MSFVHNHNARDVQDDDYAEPRNQRPARAPHRRVPAPKQRKSSYESNAEVQRWLAEHALAELNKPPFAAKFLATRRDAPWIRSSLEQFYVSDLITDIASEMKSGKEASVFRCAAHPSTGATWLAAKIYRPRIFRNLRNDAVYRLHRDQRGEGGRILSAAQRQHVADSAFAHQAQVPDWITFEFATLTRCYAAGVHVPRPWAQHGNAILMDFLGGEESSAPRLNQVTLTPAAAQQCLATLLSDIARMLEVGRVHGDLSAYNILYWEATPWIIDFGQSVDTRYQDMATMPEDAIFALLQRDIARVSAAFAPYHLAIDPVAVAVSLWEDHLHDRQ